MMPQNIEPINERSPLLVPTLTPPLSRRKALAPSKTQRFLQVVALTLATVLITALLWSMTPSMHKVAQVPPAHIQRDAEYPFARFFATKTAYWDQRDAIESNQELLTTYENALLREDLQLRQSHIVVRHGVRYPTADVIADIEALLVTLQQFPHLVPAWLRTYALPYNASVAGELGAAGEQEMHDLARRMVLATGHLEPVTFSANKSRVRHTYASRTKQSAIAYASEFFANPSDVEMIEFPQGHDPLLRFYDSCPKYVRDIKQNASAIAEFTAFEHSELLATARHALIAALGFANSTAAAAAITVKDVQAAFSACAFDYALYGTTSDWCSLMNDDIVSSVDYWDDLRAFYQLGAGHAINYEMAAVLLQDIVASMRGRIDDSNNLHTIIDVAHAETTLPLATLLGFTDRTALRADASRAAIDARAFRTSVVAPFGANVEIRLLQRKSNDEQFFVQVLVNEHEAEIPGCGDVYCDFVKVERLWKPYLEDMDFAALCRM